MQTSSQIVTNNKPTSNIFYKPDAFPVAEPTRALKAVCSTSYCSKFLTFLQKNRKNSTNITDEQMSESPGSGLRGC